MDLQHLAVVVSDDSFRAVRRPGQVRVADQEAPSIIC